MKSSLAIAALSLLASLPALFLAPEASADVAAITGWTTGLTGPNRNTAGTDRLLIFTAGMENYGDRTITSVKYGGQNLTEVVTVKTATWTITRAYIFYLDEAGIAAATSNTFTVTWSSTPSEEQYAARMYEGVNQGSPIRGFDSKTGGNSPNPISSSALNVTQGDMVVAVAESGYRGSYTWNNGFTEGVDFDSGMTAQCSTADKAISTTGTQIASTTFAVGSSLNRQVFLTAVLQGPPPPPRIFYVRPDGDDSNTGLGTSTSEAWKTVSWAATQSLNAGDMVYVMQGTYAGQIQPTVDGALGSPIHFVADTDGERFGGDGGEVIITSTANHALEIKGDHYLTFEGFNFTGSTTSCVLWEDSQGGRLERCKIKEAGHYGVYVSGSASTNLTMINCLIQESGNTGIVCLAGNLSVWNCTSVGNGGHGMYFGGSTVSVYNSIIASNLNYGIVRVSGTLTHDYNIIYGNSISNFWGTSLNSHEMIVDPLFLATDNYHLTSTSPAIDAGMNLSGSVDNDLDGISRPLGGGWDLGCYEFALVGYWTFDEGTGTTAADTSGSGNHASLESGAGWETARCANALSIDGSSGWADLGEIDVSSAGYTISVWFKSSDLNQQTIFAATAAGTNDHLILLELGTDGLLHFTHRFPAGSSGGVTLSSQTVLNDGYWHHGVAVKKKSEIILYIDGEEAAQASDSSEITTSLDMVIGRYGKGLALRHFEGIVDEVRIYGKPLTATEVGILSGLMARWKMDESSGTLASDSSLFAHDAVLYNSPTWEPVDGGTQLGALDFIGTSSYVESATSSYLDLEETYTITGWFRLESTFDSSSATSMILAEKYLNGTNGLHIALAGNDYLTASVPDGALVVKVENSNGYAFCWTANTVWKKKRWYHFAFVGNPSNPSASKLYIRGVEDTASAFGTGTGISLDYSAPFRIGGKTADSQQLVSARYFEGRLDDFRIYNRELCSDEINDHFTSDLQYRLRIIEWVEMR